MPEGNSRKFISSLASCINEHQFPFFRWQAKARRGEVKRRHTRRTSFHLVSLSCCPELRCVISEICLPRGSANTSIKVKQSELKDYSLTIRLLGSTKEEKSTSTQEEDGKHKDISKCKSIKLMMFVCYDARRWTKGIRRQKKRKGEYYSKHICFFILTECRHLY